MPKPPRTQRLRRTLAAAVLGALAIPAGIVGISSAAFAVPSLTTGAVVDEHGAGAESYLHLFRANDLSRPVASFFSESDGTFTIPDVDAGEYKLRVESSTLGGAAPVWVGDTRLPADAEVILIDGSPHDLGQTVYGPYAGVAPTADISGGVYNSNGVPAYTQIELYAPGADSPFTTVPTGIDGAWRIFNVPNGAWDVRAVPHPHIPELPAWYGTDQLDRPATPRVEVAGIARTGLEIQTQLDPDHQLYTGGRLFDENGDPVAGATVTLHRSNGDIYEFTSDEWGEFSFPATLPDTEYLIQVEHPDFESEWWQDAADAQSAESVLIIDGRTLVNLVLRLAPAAGNPGGEVCRDDFGSVIDCPEVPEVCREDLGNVIDCAEEPEACRDVLGNVIDCPEEPEVCRDELGNEGPCSEQPEVCHDPLGNEIPCTDEPGCTEGDENCPQEPECEVGDEGCPEEPECSDGCPTEPECDSTAETCPTDPSCADGEELRNGTCTTSSREELPTTGGSYAAGGMLALLGGGLLLCGLILSLAHRTQFRTQRQRGL